MSLTQTDIAARAALRARQGKGARYDAPNAPADDLLCARRGTAYFARKLMELDDAGLYRPAAAAGLTRAHVIARISYEARFQALTLEALTKGAPLDLPEALPSLDLAATLPARALRHLFQHSEVHLNVCWRDLSADQWQARVRVPGTPEMPVRALPLLRARSIWQGAIDLGNGARVADVPPGLLGAA